MSNLLDIVFPCYVTCVASNGSFYLSDWEILALCRCCQENVALFKNDVVHHSLTFHRSAIVDPLKPIVFIAIQVTGEVRERSHFERLQELSGDDDDAPSSHGSCPSRITSQGE